jgi:hypothetical protein
MSEYHHSKILQPETIRMLRLQPSPKFVSEIRCELVEYSLPTLDQRTHPYEALSYVWGNQDDTISISINNQIFDVTKNLHIALSYLRYHEVPRYIWVDAVCINQKDDKEKEDQIGLLAEIYARASRVIVWLGESEYNSDLALEAIRSAGGTSEEPSEAERVAIKQLLQRKWFRRIWVRI